MNDRRRDANENIAHAAQELSVHGDDHLLRARRSFLKKASAYCAALGLSSVASEGDAAATSSAEKVRAPSGAVRPAEYAAISPRAQSVLDRVMWDSFSGMSHIHGFNYQPSWGHDAASIWLDRFDPKLYRQELETGKKHFPAFNCVRIWLGYGAYKQNPQLLVRNFNEAVRICTELELLIIPILFTVWVGVPPFDPISIQDLGADFEKAYGRYLDELVGPHRGNPSILMWDLCNEPREGNVLEPSLHAQGQWLKLLHDRVKSIDPRARTCIGTVSDFGWGQSVADYCDALTPHFYGYPMWKPAFEKGEIKIDLDTWMSAVVAQYLLKARIFNRAAKPIVSSETCWGSPGDQERVRIIKATLGALRAYGVGFLPHALYTSGVADLYYPTAESPPYAGMADPRSMAFINADGSLRPGHDVFNDYCQKG